MKRSEPKRCNPKVFEDLDNYLSHQQSCGKPVGRVGLYDYQIYYGFKEGKLMERDNRIYHAYRTGVEVYRVAWEY